MNHTMLWLGLLACFCHSPFWAGVCILIYLLDNDDNKKVDNKKDGT